MLKELCTWLAGKTGWSIGNANVLHYGSWPQATPDDAVQLQQTGGKTQFQDTKLFQRSIQMLVRATTYDAAQTLAFLGHEYMHGMAGVTLPEVQTGETWYIQTSDALNDPMFIGRDENDRFVFSANYILRGEKRF